MKININEYDRLFWVNLEPETLEESAILLRMANMAKREPIDFTTSFYGKKIETEFAINKKDSSKVDNHIRNKKR